MNKEQLIEKYGLEWYEQYKARIIERYHNDIEYRKTQRVRDKNRYHNDTKFREFEKTQVRTRYVEAGRIDLIENYETAVNDGIENWDIHHKLELHPDGSVRFTKRSLIKLDLYYNRPPTELIWLKRSEHLRMHNKSRGLT